MGAIIKKMKRSNKKIKAKTKAFKFSKPEIHQQHGLRDSESRLKLQQKLTPVNVDKEKSKYEETQRKIKALEMQIGRLEAQIQKKLEPMKKTLGIDKLEDKIYDLEGQVDDLWDEKSRFERLVIDLLVAGRTVVGFCLRVVAKRFAISYKSICEEVFQEKPEEYQAMKEKYGSRKEQYVLVYHGEEVAKQDISQVA